MLSTSWIVALVLVSGSALAQVSIEEKEKRVEFIEKLSEDVPMMNIEVYRRDLIYEKQELSLDLRARNEANILAERVKTQISDMYQASLKETGNEEEATSAVMLSIEEDLSLISPELKDEIRFLSMQALDEAKKGSISQELDLRNIEKELLTGVEKRAEYLNRLEPSAAVAGYAPSVNAGKDAEKANYVSKSELVSSLVSNRDNARWVSTNGMTIDSSKSTSSGLDISYRISVEFLGTAIDAGPVISFSRDYTSRGVVNAEGLTPVLLPDGNFDFYKRDQNGKITKKGGKDERRFITFNCETELMFGTEYKGSGGFKVVGVGANASLSKNYKNKVNLSSRRIMVPEYVGGKTFTLNAISNICHNDFMNAKVNSAMSVKDSLNVMMKNVISSMRFSHPNTKCITDKQCGAWFAKNMMALVRNTAYPRCVEEPREKFRACVVRGLKGTKCPVYRGKKLVSDGMFEYACDKGLKCVETQQEGWFKNYDLYQYAKGRCMPINAKTYVRP